MHEAPSVLRNAGLLLGLAIAVVAPAGAQQTLEGKTAEQVYKNIQVLKGTPADQLVLSMHFVEGELGVDCVFCHLDHDPAHFPLDDKPMKQTARKMMVMVNQINNNSFGGQRVITCYTCHQGHPKPLSQVALPLPSDELLEGEKKGPALPSVDQVLAKYVQALGGEQAIRRVISRVITATQDLATGPGGKTALPAQVQRYQKAPNLAFTTYQTASGTLADGFDGTVAWSQNAKGVVNDIAPDIDQKRSKRAADFYESVDLKQQYSKMEVDSVEKIGTRDTYSVMAYPARDNPEWLFFDAQSGLLVRKISILTTQLGPSPFQVDYSDYRDTGSGVKIPFTVRMTPGTSRSEPQTHSTIHIQKVQDNVPVDSSKFMKPASKPSEK